MWGYRMMEKQNRREFLAESGKWVAAASVAQGFLSQKIMAKTGERPNVIYIMSDQQRKNTLGCYGNSQVQTPNFDRLASQGVRFDSCYASQPVCSPCRSSMVTGLFPHATGVTDNLIDLDPKLFSWPRAMKEAGYTTCYVGKWHLGYPPAPDYFDVWHGYDTGWSHWIEGTKPPVYRPDEETDFTMKFVEENKDKPFLCWLSFYPPHTPKTAPQENIDLYKGKIEPDDQVVYHAMVNRLDWNIGRLLDKLEELGLREKTLIVFTSDHGENFPENWNHHHKRLCYDSAANVPLLMSWPGTLPEGEERKQIISMVDVPVTILDLCGLKWPEDLHGQSAKKLLEGDAKGWHDTIFIENRPYVLGDKENADMLERCVVTEEWKLILNNKRPPELFNRKKDRGDTKNVYSDPANKQITAELIKRLLDWAKKTKDEVAPKLVEKMADFRIY